MNELRTTRTFGKEIQNMLPADRAAAAIELLPVFENAVSLPALQKFNEIVRLWIDKHPQP